MKILFSFLLTTALAFSASAQGKLPSVKLKDLEGNTFDTKDLLQHDGPIIVNFWATWCSPCKRELNTIHEDYIDWQAETNVKLVAVSIDDEKTKNQVSVYANGKGWDYLVLLDPNGDFKRAMGVGNPPHTFVIDKDGTIVYSHNNYAPGDEHELHQAVVDLHNKQKKPANNKK
ncbi:MAG: TlpA family protein disulfide reductase [Bacteroidetes bacterium]|nr:MAG: TlpA family protein disulfide reductase [Bacteroidota bacterium]